MTAPADAAPTKELAAAAMPISRIVIALAVMITLTGGLHYYLWARLVRDTALPPPWFALASTALALLAVAIPVSFVMSRLASRALAAPFMWVVYTWMGLLLFLLVFLAPADLASFAARWLPRGAGLSDPARRQLLARVVASSAGLGALALGAVGVRAALRPVDVARVRVALPKLPAHLSGYSIVQLTDVHVGPTIGRAFIEQLVTRANALQPDLVVITGDLVDGSVAELGPLVAPLAGLRAQDGVYFVTGNHEYYSGADEWIAFLDTLNIRVLRNERVSICGDAGFDLAGVDDWTARQFGNGHGMDLAKATAGRDTTRALVLLAHQPKAIEAAAAAGVDLQLSGHTHGGQLFPFTQLVRLDQPYIAGLHNHAGTQLYVSRGTGYWGPPMRLGAPAEITRIELVSG